MLTKEFQMVWCPEQPCLARNARCCIMLHADDVMFCGDSTYWSDVFLRKLEEKYKISYSQLEGVGSEISFLKRKLKRLDDGLALIPGTSSSKIIETFETHFGKARQQTIPCDASIQTEDLSALLCQKDACIFRSILGALLYLSRDRPDLMYTVKELSSYMSKPTMVAVSRL